MITETQIAERLTAIHTALVEKTGEQPWCQLSLDISASGKCSIGLYGDMNVRSTKPIKRITSTSIKGALDAADAFIAALPDPHEAAKRGWQKKLGAVIDEGNALNLPTEVMAPLGAASQAMSKNLIAQEAAE